MLCNIDIVNCAFVRCYLNFSPVLVVLCASFLHFYNTCLVFGAGAAAWATGAAAWATGAAAWATGATVWGIGVVAWGAATKGGATSGRGVVTISFSLIAMFSSPFARRAFISSHISLFANLSFTLGPAQYIHRVCFLAVLMLCSALTSYISGPWFRIQSSWVEFLFDHLICLVVSAAAFV